MSNQKRTESKSIFDDGTTQEKPTPWMLAVIVVLIIAAGVFA